MVFLDRKHAGQLLGQKLSNYKNSKATILALPRGGVPVASEVARQLELPLNVLLVRKIGAPFQPEYAVGAVCEDDEPHWNEKIMSRINLDPSDMGLPLSFEREKLAKQKALFRKNKNLPDLKDEIVILVDDGFATGASLFAAVKYLKKRKTQKIVVAVPVGAASTARDLRAQGSEVIVVEELEDLLSVGQWYEDFTQVSEQEVIACLDATQWLEQHLKSKKNGMKKAKFSSSDFEQALDQSMLQLKTKKDLDPLIDSIKNSRVVMLGEASHGTHEFYEMRSLISQRLIQDHGFKFIAVEGDWPDAYRIHRYIQSGQGGSAKRILMENNRWPTWMWANNEVAKLVEWLRKHQAGFFGLDVYSLFSSIQEVVRFVDRVDTELAREIERRYSCFDTFEGNEILYARSLLNDPTGCQNEALSNLQKILELRIESLSEVGDELFSAQQNARVVANAESYYRSMLQGDASSWNLRDIHMMETLDLLLDRAGESGKAIVWAHNTHVGDYRATDMKSGGYVNLGGLARQSYGAENVSLVGFGTYEGEVSASTAWGRQEKVMDLPPARKESFEHHFHQAAVKSKIDQFYLLLKDHQQGPFAQTLGHRAVGVVYDPIHEKRGNYVPTELSKRYDAFVFIDRTHALRSLEVSPTRGQFPDTWPTGV